MSKTIYSFILLVFCFGFPIWSEQEIEWGPSRIAKSYKLEVREFNTKKVKIDTKVKTTKYKVNKLKPGIYEYRIGIINDKDTIVIYSDWTSLSVLLALDPEGSIDEVYFGGKTDRFQEFYITGNNFVEDTTVEIYSAKEKIPIKNFVRLSSTELKFTLDITNASKGTYDLKIINPLNKVFVKKNFYVLGKTKQDAEKEIEEANRISQEGGSGIETKYLLRSIVVPGWGQYRSGVDNESTFRKIRGGIYLFSFLGTGGYLAIQYQSYISQTNKVNQLKLLNNVVNYPYQPPLSDAGLYISQEFNTNVAELYQQWHTVSNTAFALLGIYIINLIDAYFFTGDIEKINTMYYPMKPTEWKAYINPDQNGSMQIGRSYNIEYSIRF
ncbi:MAG: hypothetical protein IPL26_29270 [Leptospiraceae bacterium]|nr:hypothetical protein [Leptospiraceae bacterium]